MSMKIHTGCAPAGSPVAAGPPACSFVSCCCGSSALPRNDDALTLSDMSKQNVETNVIVAYRAPPALAAALDRAAVKEGITRSDVARRAALRDLRRAGLYPAAEPEE